MKAPNDRIVDVDILVSGAGAAGLTLAIDLARRGVSFALIEQASTPFHGSRGKGIQPRTQEIFEDLGLVDRIFAAGGPYPSVRDYDANGAHADSVMMEPRAQTPTEPFRAPLMLPQFLTEGAMRERLGELGHRPLFGHRLHHFEQDAAGVLARVVVDGAAREIRARYLIATDGGRSFIREYLNVGFPGRSLGVRAVVADLEMTGLDRAYWHRFNAGSEGSGVMFCPLAGTNLFQLQATVPLEGDVDLSTAGLEAMYAIRTGRDDITISSVSWASIYSMSARLADRYREGRVFLAGDAAHIHPPTGAQGLNTSVQDAYNLGWKLAAVIAGAPEALLDSYEAERRPIAAAMLKMSTEILRTTNGNRMYRGRDVHQLDVGYPDSAVSMPSATEEGPLLPGDRAPDAQVMRASGYTARLFDLFRGPHWTLIGDQVDEGQFEPRAGLHVHRLGADIHDPEGVVRATYGLNPGDWALIRPDGYVGAIVPGNQSDALETYLQGLGLRA